MPINIGALVTELRAQRTLAAEHDAPRAENAPPAVEETTLADIFDRSYDHAFDDGYARCRKDMEAEAARVQWRDDERVMGEKRNLIRWLRRGGAPLAPAEVFEGFDALCAAVAACYTQPEQPSTVTAGERHDQESLSIADARAITCLARDTTLDA